MTWNAAWVAATRRRRRFQSLCSQNAPDRQRHRIRRCRRGRDSGGRCDSDWTWRSRRCYRPRKCRRERHIYPLACRPENRRNRRPVRQHSGRWTGCIARAVCSAWTTCNAPLSWPHRCRRPGRRGRRGDNPWMPDSGPPAWASSALVACYRHRRRGRHRSRRNPRRRHCRSDRPLPCTGRAFDTLSTFDTRHRRPLHSDHSGRRNAPRRGKDCRLSATRDHRLLTSTRDMSGGHSRHFRPPDIGHRPTYTAPQSHTMAPACTFDRRAKYIVRTPPLCRA